MMCWGDNLTVVYSRRALGGLEGSSKIFDKNTHRRVNSGRSSSAVQVEEIAAGPGVKGLEGSNHRFFPGELYWRRHLSEQRHHLS